MERGSTDSLPSATGSHHAWTEVRVLAPVGWHELVAEALHIGPCTSAAFGRKSLGEKEPPEGWDYVRAFLPALADHEELRRQITAAVATLSERAAEPELAGIAVEFRPLPLEDYATSWRKSWKPFRLGRLCLLPPWDPRRPRPGELRLTIEPGAAFGSGRHATTRACLCVLLERVRPGARVLDAGSGSGILTVAAALLGARRALGFDVDPLVVPIARELARSNGVERACTFRAGGFEVLGPDDTSFDGVLANISADVIEQRAAELAARLRPGGWFAFGCCPAPRAAAARTAVREADLRIDDERTRGRWHTFTGLRPADDAASG